MYILPVPFRKSGRLLDKIAGFAAPQIFGEPETKSGAGYRFSVIGVSFELESILPSLEYGQTSFNLQRGLQHATQLIRTTYCSSYESKASNLRGEEYRCNRDLVHVVCKYLRDKRRAENSTLKYSDYKGPAYIKGRSAYCFFNVLVQKLKVLEGMSNVLCSVLG